MEEDTGNVVSYSRVRERNFDSSSPSSELQHPVKLRKVPCEKFKGVVLLQNGHWGAQIYTDSGRIWLGTFKSNKEAAMAYDSAYIKLRNDEHSRNIPLNCVTAKEPEFQRHLSKEAVLSMIKDGTYQSRFQEYLRKHQHYNPNINICEMSLWTSTIKAATDIKTKGPPNGLQLFHKELTLSDVGKLNRLVIPKKYAVRHFPRLADSAASVNLRLMDRQKKEWNFRYCYWKSSQSFVFTKGWNGFVREKHLKEKDVIAFYKVKESESGIDLMIDKQTLPGVRLFGVRIDKTN